MKRIIPILIAILICFGVGCTASYFQSESILNWYPALEKPSCTPPDIAFPIAWSFIYLCMGISIGLIWHIWTIRRQMIIRLFGFQLLFNFTWSIFFFYFRSPLLGFANILVLDVLVIYYMIESYPVRKSSAYLFVPYLLWLLLATYIIRKSKFPQNPKRSVRFSGKRTKRSVQKRKARNTQKAETKVL